jgi:hypothetical protein
MPSWERSPSFRNPDAPTLTIPVTHYVAEEVHNTDEGQPLCGSAPAPLLARIGDKQYGDGTEMVICEICKDIAQQRFRNHLPLKAKRTS